jgi:hypothetical protein
MFTFFTVEASKHRLYDWFIESNVQVSRNPFLAITGIELLARTSLLHPVLIMADIHKS